MENCGKGYANYTITIDILGSGAPGKLSSWWGRAKNLNKNKIPDFVHGQKNRAGSGVGEIRIESHKVSYATYYGGGRVNLTFSSKFRAIKL